MSFQSAQFFVFLAAVLLLYHAVPARAKTPVLLAASWLFYACASAAYLPLLLAACALAWAVGRALGAAPAAEGGGLSGAPPFAVCRRLRAALPRPAFRRCLLGAVLALLLGSVCFFKYAGPLMAWLGAPAGVPAAPLGVSFYTFALSGYVIDQYRRAYPPEKSFFRLALFAGFFPVVSSGPIERGGHFLPQLRQARAFCYEDFCRGASRMLWGFFKKFVVADTIAVLVDSVFGDLASFTGPYLCLAVLLYSYQLYCDFSGYSDIAIGTARLLGFSVCENFARPFAARSFRALWRRWHISLTGWFREYLYFPLGGSRRGAARTCLNTLLVFLVSGLWHGSGATFAVWGLLNGAYLALGRATQQRRARLLEKTPLARHPALYAAVQVAAVYLLFSSCIVFFRAQSLADAASVYSRLFTGWGEALRDLHGVRLALNRMGVNKTTGPLLLACVPFVEWVEWRAACGGVTTDVWMRARNKRVRLALYYALALALMLFGMLGDSSFIYFAF